MDLPDADAAWFRRVEAIEDMGNAIGIQAGTVVLDDSRGGFALDPRAHDHHALFLGSSGHRFERIHDKVDDDLLQLYRIRPNQRRRIGQFGADGDPLPFDRAA